jgi:hypothetical protein
MTRWSARMASCALVAFAVAGMGGGWTTRLALASDYGEIAIDTASPKVTLGSSAIVLRIANKGGGIVRGVAIEANAPTGITVADNPSVIGDLAAGSSVLTTIAIRGLPKTRPALLVVQASGRSNAGSTTALTAVDLVPAEVPTSLTLVGDDRLSDSSPANLVAVVTNLADVSVDVLVSATAGKNDVRLSAEGGNVVKAVTGAPVALSVPARGFKVVLLQVKAHGLLRRGTSTVVLGTARTTLRDEAPMDVTASSKLDASVSADVLPGLLGVGSVLAIPGLVAIWAGLAVVYRDRRRIGLEPPPAARQIWENKLWFLPAAAVSLLAAGLYSAAVYREVWSADLLDAYTLRDVFLVTWLAGLGGAAVAASIVHAHRRKVAVVTPTSQPIEVLKAASRADPRAKRSVYQTPDSKLGLLIHADGKAVVLAPPVEFTEMDIAKALQGDGSLPNVIDGVRAAREGDYRMRFMRDDKYINGPRAVLGATPSGVPKELLLKYYDDALD